MLDLILHLDTHLLTLTQEYGTWVYGILFLVIFSETGLVIAPFLPGDSLMFVAGALSGMGSLELQVLLPLLMLAAFSGDNTNYWIGRLLGLRLIQHTGSRLIKHEYLERTHAFYEKHGGKTIIFARFLPILRTFVPFVAGIGTMSYRLFLLFSAVGSLAWITTFTLVGYFFGNIPVVKNNLTLMTLGIIAITLLPALIEFVRHRRRNKPRNRS
ncbi:MAG: DedA family protein [Gallionellaceae bacterium]